MKKILAICLAVMLCCTSFAFAETEQEAQADTIRWNVNEDNTLTVWLEANDTTGYSWSCTISDGQLLVQIVEEYEADDTGLLGSGGTWSATFRPVDGEAGVVTITFLYTRSWTDEPEMMVPMELYLDGTGYPQVLTVNGEEITALDL